MAETPLQKSIRESATDGVSETDVDGTKVVRMPIGEQIEADKYLANKAALQSRKLPLRFARVRPGGAV